LKKSTEHTRKKPREKSMHRFANPTTFMRIANAIFPWAAGLSIVLFLVGLPVALITSPPDYQQGDSVRLFYIHVPAAWCSLMVYGSMAVSSAAFLIWRHPIANISARAMAPIGTVFTALTLATGMLWGQPMWGTFWVWDARLTSYLLLFFLYLGYIALADAFEDSERGDKAAAILAVVGSVNLPIINLSVEWWNTLHQPSIIKMSGFTVDGSILLPLFLMLGAFTSYTIAVWVLRLRSELLSAKLRNARMSEVGLNRMPAE
jgi:heme exporter protein C